MKITMQEIENAIALAAPPEGQPWEPAPIARSLAKLVAQEAEQERAAREAWEEGRTGWAVRFAPTPTRFGDPEGVRSLQDDVLAQHEAAIERRIKANRQIISGIGSSIVALGTGAINGGMTMPALVAGAMEIARQIAQALNDPAS